MSDTYQAIYDAVRSKISGGDIGRAFTDIARDALDMSWARDQVRDEFMRTATEGQRPSVLFRPTLSQDGNAWLAIYGDLPTGVVGTGSTPAEAMAAFDAAWHKPAQEPTT